MSQMPIKRSDIAALMKRYETEHKFIDELNLKKVMQQTFSTLEKSLSIVTKYDKQFGILNPPRTLNLEYDSPLSMISGSGLGQMFPGFIGGPDGYSLRPESFFTEEKVAV